MRLADKVTIITGASRGLGRAFAVRFGREGARLVLASRARADVDATGRMVREAGAKAIVTYTDVTRWDDVKAMADAALGEFGRIDVLINNAGIAGPVALCEEIAEADWDETFAVNVKGPWLCCKAIIPTLKAQRSGRIINIGSVSSKRQLPSRTPYTAGKMALIGFTRTLAWELGGFGITVNLICPGPLPGPRWDRVVEGMAKVAGITPQEAQRAFLAQAALKRLAEADDVASLAVFLASDESRNMTGQDINVTAGLIMY
jgi:NAD(P)-dependent dehydrogenase (short-subunit alcohol dehydrogenase family)